jgi:hypothetical protein
MGRVNKLILIGTSSKHNKSLAYLISMDDWRLHRQCGDFLGCTHRFWTQTTAAHVPFEWEKMIIESSMTKCVGIERDTQENARRIDVFRIETGESNCRHINVNAMILLQLNAICIARVAWKTEGMFRVFPNQSIRCIIQIILSLFNRKWYQEGKRRDLVYFIFALDWCEESH